jgi:hypothetical protein
VEFAPGYLERFRRSLPAEAIDELLSGPEADRRPGQHREYLSRP